MDTYILKKKFFVVFFSLFCQLRSESTWEPEENLEYCLDVIVEFEKKLKSSSLSSSSTSTSINKLNNNNNKSNLTRGFDKGLAPEKILGATDSNGHLMYLMKWKNSDEADLVSSKTANIKCPQLVIQFYEERLTWLTNGSCGVLVNQEETHQDNETAASANNNILNANTNTNTNTNTSKLQQHKNK